MTRAEHAALLQRKRDIIDMMQADIVELEAVVEFTCGKGIPMGPMVRGMWVCEMADGHEGECSHTQQNAVIEMKQ